MSDTGSTKPGTLDRRAFVGAAVAGTMTIRHGRWAPWQASAPPNAPQVPSFALEELTIGAEEYPKLLSAVYRATDLPDKPRNIFGLAKSIPPAEMEALLLASYRVDDEALATLANRRAQAVKERLAREGGVGPERIFIVKSKLGSEGIKDQGAPTRVDFSIR